MAFSSVMSAVLQGLFVVPVYVEADVSNGLPMFHMVGYLSSEVKEASERVRTAIRNSGISIPPRKIVINMAPATVRKRGASFDLPVALAVLCTGGNLFWETSVCHGCGRVESGRKGKKSIGDSSYCNGSERKRDGILHCSVRKCK